MNITASIRESLRILRERWGLFAVTLVSSVAVFGPVTALAFVHPALFSTWWMTPVLWLAAAAAAAVSEGVLIVAVRDQRRGIFSWPRTIRDAGARFSTLFSINMVGALLSVVTLAAWKLVGALFAAGRYDLAVALIALLLLPWVAFQVTLTSWIWFSLRLAIVEERGARSALAAGFRFLHGRLRDSLKLVVTSGALSFGLSGVLGALVGVLFLVCGLLLHSIGWGLPVALGVALFALAIFAVSTLPKALISSLWTVSFLDARGHR